MHKNTYTAKTLIGNWQEERSTDKFEDDNEIAIAGPWAAHAGALKRTMLTCRHRRISRIVFE